jgi:NAD(P)-dependent dehydrogenase (short-subunit alcohol dehydrogenase family)
MSKPIALILGAGPRVGASVAATFASKGYQVAVASRKGTGDKTPEGYLSLAADLTKPDSVPKLFDSVKASFGAVPAVVVYNAASLTPPPDQESPLSIPTDRFVSDLNINTVSPYVAAQKAVEAWTSLPGDVKKTFIYTGNRLNVHIPPVPLFLNLGVGKSASAYWISVADQNYAARGYR